MKRKILAAVMAVLMLSLLSVQAFAVDDFDGATQPIGLGTLSEEELSALRATTSGECTECASNSNARHYNAMGHTHHFLGVTSQYQTRKFRKIGAELLSPVNYTSTLGVSESLAVSNNCSTTIEFSDGVVTSALGFSVSYSATTTATYEIELPPGETARIDIYNVFNTYEFDCMTVWTFNGSSWNEYGTGVANQWSHFGFTVVYT